MVHLQRMAKRHPGLRSFLAVLLSIAMVLNSVPAAAFAEEVNELQEVIGMAEPEAQPEEEATDDELVAEASEEAPSEEALPEEAAPTEEADVEVASDGEAVPEEANLDAPVAPEVATKRTYTFEDAAVKVTATLEKADAIPDAAELKVTAVTEESEDYNYAAYMGALNKDFEGMDAYTAENTLLYDVAFLMTDESGNTVEVEPESGSVKFKLEFKKNQLSENISAEDAKSVQLIHLPLKEDVRDAYDTTAQAVEIEASDVLVESVDASLTVGSKEDASFVLDSLSIIAASTHPDSFGPTDQTNSQVNFSLALGRAVEYGIVADTYDQKNHQQTNFAVKRTTRIAAELMVSLTWQEHGRCLIRLAAFLIIPSLGLDRLPTRARKSNMTSICQSRMRNTSMTMSR